MGSSAVDDSTTIDGRIAARLRALRGERGWSLDDLARRSGVSRATLSRLENAEVSATATALGRLCAAYGLTMSRLMHMIEEDGHAALVRREAQAVWTDRNAGFLRRQVSPPAASLAGEVVESTLEPATTISYDAPPRAGAEHHLVLLDGRLDVTVGGATHALAPGDCLRFRLHGPSAFATPKDAGARYLLFVV